MSSIKKNLSKSEGTKIKSVKPYKFGIVCSEWNFEITISMANAAIDTLKKHGALEKNIFVEFVPGSFELTLGAQRMAMSKRKLDAVICIGCVIQGETRHFDFICSAVANGITELNIKFNKPIIFGVLTPNTQEQAIERAGGKHGNKGVEAAVTAMKMLGGK